MTWKWTVAIIVGWASVAAGQLPRFRGIGVPAGWNGSSLRAVSGDGNVAVGSVVGPSTAEAQAFRWTAEGGFQLLGDLAGGEDASTARDVSGDGSYIVGVG